MNETPRPTDDEPFEKPRISMAVLGIILVCAVIGALLWMVQNKLPAVSSPLATSTPTATITFTPTNISTSTSTATPTVTFTPRPTPTATPDKRVLNPANQHLYLYVKQRKTWHEARDYCALQGGHLVTIQAPSENRFVYELEQLAYDSTQFGVWLGATDEVEEGTWVWVTGETWNYWNWHQDPPWHEPNNKHSGEVKVNADFLAFANVRTWMDWSDDNFYFVCEWESTAP